MEGGGIAASAVKRGRYADGWSGVGGGIAGRLCGLGRSSCDQAGPLCVRATFRFFCTKNLCVLVAAAPRPRRGGRAHARCDDGTLAEGRAVRSQQVLGGYLAIPD